MFKQVHVEPPLLAVNMMLPQPALAAQHWHLQNDICSMPVAIHGYLLPTGCSAANLLAAVLAVD